MKNGDKNNILRDLQVSLDRYSADDEAPVTLADTRQQLCRVGNVIYELARLALYKEHFEGRDNTEALA